MVSSPVSWKMRVASSRLFSHSSCSGVRPGCRNGLSVHLALCAHLLSPSTDYLASRLLFLRVAALSCGALAAPGLLGASLPFNPLYRLSNEVRCPPSTSFSILSSGVLRRFPQLPYHRATSQWEECCVPLIRFTDPVDGGESPQCPASGFSGTRSYAPSPTTSASEDRPNGNRPKRPPPGVSSRCSSSIGSSLSQWWPWGTCCLIRPGIFFLLNQHELSEPPFGNS